LLNRNNFRLLALHLNVTLNLLLMLTYPQEAEKKRRHPVYRKTIQLVIKDEMPLSIRRGRFNYGQTSTTAVMTFDHQYLQNGTYYVLLTAYGNGKSMKPMLL